MVCTDSVKKPRCPMRYRAAFLGVIHHHTLLCCSCFRMANMQCSQYKKKSSNKDVPPMIGFAHTMHPTMYNFPLPVRIYQGGIIGDFNQYLPYLKLRTEQDISQIPPSPCHSNAFRPIGPNVKTVTSRPFYKFRYKLIIFYCRSISRSRPNEHPIRNIAEVKMRQKLSRPS